MDPGTIIQNAVGKTGPYQIWITFLIFGSRFSVNQHQLVILVVSPPVGNFTCTDPSLGPCDEKCPSHSFDHSVWENTIDYQWDLVCSRAYYKSMIQSAVMGGVLLGNVSFGYFADRYGRLKPLVIGMIILVASSTAAAFAPWLWLYILLRVLSTYALGGTMFPVYSILMEFTDIKYRTTIGILFTIPCSIGQELLALTGYFIRRWDYIQLSISVPMAALILYWWLLPESPRWLLAVGKGDKCVKVLEKAAKCNKLPTEHIRPQVEKYLSSKPEETTGGNMADLFRTKRMRTKTLILFFNWAVVAATFFGAAQYVGQISGNMFLNIAIAGLFQVAGVTMSVFMIDTIGRKWSQIISYLIISIPMFVITFLGKSVVIPIQVLSGVSMMGSGMSFALIYVYSAELYPTLVRTLGMGLSSMCARAGAMSAPFIMHLPFWAPPLVFATLTLTAAISIFVFLPETKGCDLVPSVELADRL